MNLLCALLLLFLCLCSNVINLQNDNFGPYVQRWDKFELCKGPKQGHCGKVRLENLQNKSDVIFVLDFARDCPVTQAKITIASMQKNNSTKKLWNYSLDHPCQHFVLGPLLIESFNLTNNCKINKGYYEVHVNMLEKNAMFLGSSFFYGNYRFKIMAYNKIHNFFCVDVLLGIEKNTNV